MGCDIHIIAEVKEGNTWVPNSLKIFKNSYYDPHGKFDWQHDELIVNPTGRRHYDWFSILANVRNGYGFAGVITGQEFAVIAKPRGVPLDASADWQDQVQQWEGDMHSHSWLTIEDFDAFDWNQVCMKTGVIPLVAYTAIRGTNVAPDEWSGSISGPNIVTITEAKADKLLLQQDDLIDVKFKKDIYVQYYWSILYREWFADELEQTIAPLRELTKKYGQARLCFGFDN